MEKRYTENEVDAEVAAIEQGLSDQQVAERRAEIERKYNLPAGALNKSKLSAAEVERQKIYPEHYSATIEEVDKMSPEEYSRWRDLGAWVKKTPEQVALDAEQEERDRARAAELEKIEAMSIEEYVAYQEQKAKEAKQQDETAARLMEQEQQNKVNALRRKNPAEMSMSEYEQWTKVR